MQVSEHTALRWRSSAAAPPARRIVAGMLAPVRAILRRLRAGHQARVAIRQLESLSEWQLKDIGMHQDQIWRLARGVSTSSTRSGHAED
jgi:hypothetical protein